MWPFKTTTTLKNSNIFQNFTDHHSHILPGVDDGVQTMEESLQILHRYEELGVKTVWLTPHIMEDVPNTPSQLRDRFAELQVAYNGPITLRLSAENMLDNLFTERLAKKDLLPYGAEQNELLVETSYFTPPYNFHETLKQIKSAGFHPVLAHPERYVYMSSEDYAQLQSMDIRFQLNLFSLVGMYGPEAKKKAEYLLRQGFYDRTGTDLHALRALEKGLVGKIDKSVISNIL